MEKNMYMVCGGNSKLNSILRLLPNILVILWKPQGLHVFFVQVAENVILCNLIVPLYQGSISNKAILKIINDIKSKLVFYADDSNLI